MPSSCMLVCDYSTPDCGQPAQSSVERAACQNDDKAGMSLATGGILGNACPACNSTLILAVLWAIGNNFVRYTTSPLTIVQYASTTPSHGYQNDLIDALLQETDNDFGIHVRFLLENTRIYNMGMQRSSGLSSRYNILRGVAIWFVDSFVAFKRLEADLLDENSLYSRNGFFCIVYTGSESNKLKTIQRIFQRLFDIYVLNVNVYVVLRNVTFVYTYFPFRPNRCRSSVPVLHISFEDMFRGRSYDMGTKEFFPNKLTNMNQCELVVATFQHEPYVMYDEGTIAAVMEAQLLRNKENNRGVAVSSPQFLGIEGELFKLIAFKMNFTYSLLQPDFNDRGAIFPNGTITGAAAMIVDGLANITFNCYMYNKARADVMLPSISYLSFPILITIPRGQPMSPFERLIKPFTVKTWCSLSTTVLLSLCGILVLRVHARLRMIAYICELRNGMPIANLWSMLLGGPSTTRLPRQHLVRYVLILWLLYTLVLRTAYTGELYRLLQDGHARNSVKTLNEAIQRNYFLYTVQTMLAIFNLMPNMHIKLIGKEFSMEDLMHRLQAEDDAEFFMPALLPTVEVFNQRFARENNQRIRVLDEPLMTSPLTIYMRKHSYLEHRLNSLLLSFMATGLVHKYEKFYLDRASHKATRGDFEPVRLTVWLLFGIFAVYLLLVAFALLIFVLELATLRWRRVARIMDCANFYFC